MVSCQGYRLYNSRVFLVTVFSLLIGFSAVELVRKFRHRVSKSSSVIITTLRV